MNPDHLLRYAIRPALDHMGLGGRAAEELVLGTAIVESGLLYLRQHNDGPALGFWQMEPGTHDDIYYNFLVYYQNLRTSLARLTVDRIAYQFSVEERRPQLTWNLRYGAAMCRLKYYRNPNALPKAGDLRAQARYWKAHYNSWMGKGTVEKYIKAWRNKMG